MKCFLTSLFVGQVEQQRDVVRGLGAVGGAHQQEKLLRRWDHNRGRNLEEQPGNHDEHSLSEASRTAGAQMNFDPAGNLQFGNTAGEREDHGAKEQVFSAQPSAEGSGDSGAARPEDVGRQKQFQENVVATTRGTADSALVQEAESVSTAAAAHEKKQEASGRTGERDDQTKDDDDKQGDEEEEDEKR